ncbi:MAG: hypothetical protein ACQKBT_06895 [Puniceicoccales bacterium]
MMVANRVNPLFALMGLGLLLNAGAESSVVDWGQLPGTRTLRSELMEVEVMDPVAPGRYNQGVRFSPVANVLRVTMDGRNFLYAPLEHNMMTENGGLAMEFDVKFDEGSPPGFADAAWGEGFLKVGVGVLGRHGENYDFYAQYPLLEPAITQVEWFEDRARFSQVSAVVQGYAYQLDSEIVVSGNELQITHRLTNTGERRLETENYAHNFYRFDNQNCDESYIIEIDYDFYSVIMNPPIERRGRMLVFAGEFEDELPVSRIYIFPHEADRDSDSITITNARNGMRVVTKTIPNTGRSLIHSEPDYLSPEQFVRLDLEPGESDEWTRIYRFEVL